MDESNLVLGIPMQAIDLVGYGVAPQARPSAGPEVDVRHALAERYVESLRVGRVGRDAHEARLKVPGLRGGESVEIRLRHEDGRLHATLACDDDLRARSLARRVQFELDAAGLEADEVAIEP